MYAKQKLFPLRSSGRLFLSLLLAAFLIAIPASSRTQPTAADAKPREAISLSLDQKTMANVLLQKQAQPASALLWQWLSGYAFLFTVETNIDREKKFRATLPAITAAGTEPLRLRVNAQSDLGKLLAERVVVNARQAAILPQVVNRPSARNATIATNTSSNSTAGGAHLFAWHFSSLRLGWRWNRW